MRKTKILIYLFLFCGTLYGQNTEIVPTARQIVTEFYSMYNTSFLDFKSVSFEKRKMGWFIESKNIVNNELVPYERFLFYENQSKSFLPIKSDFIERRETRLTNVDISEYIDEYDLNNLELQIYFGYNGWYNDVVYELAEKTNLTDNELYGLGRAYSAKALNLVSDMAGFSVKEEIWPLRIDINCMTDSQTNVFLGISKKGVQCFKKLLERNPDYETRVGKIGMKYANEVMWQYQILLAYADRKAATFNLPADLYSEDQLKIAREYLSACPQGSVFLSFGDNDYYPLHYLQKRFGFRNDVYIVNYNLLGIDRYIFRTGYAQLGAEMIKLSVDSSFYTAGNNEIIIIADSVADFQMKTIKDFFANGKKDYYSRSVLNANRIILSVEMGKKEDWIRSKTEKVILLNGVSYLFKNQWILLDIIENLGIRQICFPNLFDDQLRGLNEHLEKRSSVWLYNKVHPR